MALLNDLDVKAWIALAAAVFVCSCSMFLSYQDWRNNCRVEVAQRVAILWVPVLLFLIGALSSYSTKARAPQSSVEGVVRYVGERHGRSFSAVFICATSCQRTGGYSLALYGKAAKAVKVGADLRFTYLERPIGSVYTGTWLQVTKAVDPNSGQVVYALDVANHPFRISAYLFDAMLMVLAVLFARRLRGKQPGGKGELQDSGEEQDAGEMRADKIIPI